MHTAAPNAASRSINRAMLFGGFSAFALLYCMQPLMPDMARQFALTPAQSSWPLSISTLMMALALLASGALSDRIGRKRLMSGALTAAAVLVLLCAFARSLTELLVLRALLGLALGAVPAVAMAYLTEEIDAASLGYSMGIYIGGTALGGTAGRVLASVISDAYSWRLAMVLLGVAGLYAAWEFQRSLPASRRFVAARPGWSALTGAVAMHLKDGALPWLFALAFLLMGVFVSLYNYIGYRLLGSPFGLGQSTVGVLALLYLPGYFSAVWAGKLADRIGRRKVLWIVMAAMLAGLLLTLANALLPIIAGMALFTVAFFAAHSVASSWVGRRARAPKALATALYLFSYYMGAGVIGSLAGLVWSAAGWSGVVVLLGGALGLALLIALRLRGVAPLAVLPAPACA